MFYIGYYENVCDGQKFMPSGYSLEESYNVIKNIAAQNHSYYQYNIYRVDNNRIAFSQRLQASGEHKQETYLILELVETVKAETNNKINLFRLTDDLDEHFNSKYELIVEKNDNSNK